MRILQKILFIATAAMLGATQVQAVIFFARPYDPNLQRWIQRDPIGERGGVNLYGYVKNNPVNKVDPLGLEPGFGNPVYGANGNPVGPSTPYGPNYPLPVFGSLLPGPGQVPPGYNPSWQTGTDSRGPFVEDPNNGTKYYPHPEDEGHWPHYDDSKGGRYPEKCVKPWPGQKRPPYGDQSPNNPWPESEPPARPSVPLWELPFIVPTEFFAPFFLGPAQLYTDPNQGT
jgi:hypothetical protein